MRVDVRVQEADFDVGREYTALTDRLPAHSGAVASFVGLVRDLHPAPDGTSGTQVQTLHLEHYPGMTERSIESIVGRAQQRWPLIDVVVVHRVGTLAPRAQIVFVQIAAAHRAAAFAACEFIMDYLKTDAVFWKREDTTQGSHWVEATAADQDRIKDWGGADA